MPNWCDNTLYISATKKENLDEFEKAVNEKNLFHTFVPMPAELVDTKSPSDSPNETLIKLFGHDNWYDWRLANWGTKWEASDVQIDRPTNLSMYIIFNTAWGPPDIFFQRLGKMFPKLTFIDSWSIEGGHEGAGNIRVHANTYEES